VISINSFMLVNEMLMCDWMDGMALFRGVKISQNSRSRLKILGVIRVTRSKFDAQNTQIYVYKETSRRRTILKHCGRSNHSHGKFFLPISALNSDWKYWRINVETVKCSCHCVSPTCVHFVEVLVYMSEGRGFDSDEVIEIFHWLNRSGSTVTLGSTQPLTEMSTNEISWG
jgi:hypothetical protein